MVTTILALASSSTSSAQFSDASQASIKPPTLHMILLVDTSEPSRKADRLVDLGTNKSLMSKVEETMEGELAVNKVIIKDTNWGGDAVINKCKSLDIQPHDAVYFFYNGHGFRTATMDAANDNFPALALQVNDDGTRDDVKLSDIYKTLKAKNPRLLIVIADTCNSMVSSAYDTPTRGLFRKQLCKELFVNSRGNYLASGAQPREPSWTNHTTGSFFTNAFVDSVQSVLESNSYDESTSGWESIFKKSCATIHLTDSNGNPTTQTPQYQKNPDMAK